jgi:hypothetical protein
MVTYEPFQFDHYLSFQRSYTATEAIIDLRGTHPVIMSQRVWLRDLRPLSDEAGTILRWEEGPENEGRLADVLPPEDIAEDGYDEGYDLPGDHYGDGDDEIESPPPPNEVTGLDDED